MQHSMLRLGIVPYLNVLPLLEGLDSSIPKENWIRATPRELATLLQNQEIDFATLPIFDVLRSGGNYKILGKCSISSNGPVRSVRIFSHKPITTTKRILLDVSSLTSCHLAMILCREYLKNDAEFTFSEKPITRDFDLKGSQYDSVMVIGDVALEWQGSYPYELDLGEAWKQLTGLPFVFAAWACWAETPISLALHELFVSARKLGERQVYEIAKRHAGTHQRELRDLVDYLSLSLRYNLRPEQREAIDLYRQKLIAHGLLPAGTPSLVIESPIEAARL
ncbi:MAG: menaquinone biosynthetic enzyme MqnA/MqnD family protein [Sumerlaeia bacterium]